MGEIMVLQLLVGRREKAAAQRSFRQQLEAQLGFRAEENIGYQGGGGTFKVYSQGPGTLYYAYNPPNTEDITPRHWNSFGIYGSNGVGGIGVEINIPSEENSGRVAGFFARDIETGLIFVMHDGGIGGGRKGIGKDSFLAWMGEDLELAVADGTRRVGLRVAELSSPDLSTQIWNFVMKVDRFKIEASNDRLNTSKFKSKVSRSAERRKALLRSEATLQANIVNEIALREPRLYADYDRRAVHDLFEPDTIFTPQTGKWGISGIVRLNDRPGDFVLFVTFGKEEGTHAFDESISDTGIVRWQSQPKQRFSDRSIAELIEHDERTNTLHLFLRTSSRRGGVPPPYTYLGPLRYVEHDADREQPVHIAWELLNWPIPKDVVSAMQLTILSERDLADASISSVSDEAPASSGQLAQEDPPKGNGRKGESTRSFKAMKRRYLSSEESRDLGLKGELLVFANEKQRLTSAGRCDLADGVSHVSVDEGDGAGYDIASFFADGRPKFIEVKTTTGPKSAEFFISPGEVAFSAEKRDQFELCRLFEFDARLNCAKYYSIFGAVEDHFELTQTQFRARAE